MGLISRVSSRTYRRSFFLNKKKCNSSSKTKTKPKPWSVKPPSPSANSEKPSMLPKLDFFAGQELNNEDASLEDLKIQDESTIEIVHRVVGGGRKRKKKVYTAPKKIKHKPKKVKLATLKYYKITDTGKVERKRKECPAAICGPGVFMANHKDRHYCGKCYLTVVFNENEK